MFSGEIYYTNPLIQLTKSLVKQSFSLLFISAVAVMYSRNIPMAEKRIVCFQSKKVKMCRFLFYFLQLLYVFENIF